MQAFFLCFLLYSVHQMLKYTIKTFIFKFLAIFLKNTYKYKDKKQAKKRRFLTILKAMEGTALKNIINSSTYKYIINSSTYKYVIISSTYKYVIKSMSCIVYRIETFD